MEGVLSKEEYGKLEYLTSAKGRTTVSKSREEIISLMDIALLLNDKKWFIYLHKVLGVKERSDSAQWY